MFLFCKLNGYILFSDVLKRQTFNIIVTMDAFGNPSGLASDLKESFEGLLFEGDLSAFVGGLGYGITNSISKVSSICIFWTGLPKCGHSVQFQIISFRFLFTLRGLRLKLQYKLCYSHLVHSLKFSKLCRLHHQLLMVLVRWHLTNSMSLWDVGCYAVNRRVIIAVRCRIFTVA